jgi:hypothetical protein
MRDGRVNRPSIEPSGLISARKIAPHTTSREDKAYGRGDRERRGGQTRVELWQFFLRRVSDSKEEGLQPSLLVTGGQRDAGFRTSWSQLGGG